MSVSNAFYRDAHMTVDSMICSWKLCEMISITYFLSGRTQPSEGYLRIESTKSKSHSFQLCGWHDSKESFPLPHTALASLKRSCVCRMQRKSQTHLTREFSTRHSPTVPSHVFFRPCTSEWRFQKKLPVLTVSLGLAEEEGAGPGMIRGIVLHRQIWRKKGEIKHSYLKHSHLI